jgi:fatty-acyl-CoA synthase
LSLLKTPIPEYSWKLPMKNLSHWPPGLPPHLELPQTSLYYNLEVSAQRYPTRTAIAYYGNTIPYAELKQQIDALAGFLQQRCAVAKGDRVALYMQNSPQFIMAFFAILRADAVVVLVNTMNLLEEVRHVVTDPLRMAISAGQCNTLKTAQAAGVLH